MTSPLPHQSRPLCPPQSEKFNCGHYVKECARHGICTRCPIRFKLRWGDAWSLSKGLSGTETHQEGESQLEH